MPASLIDLAKSYLNSEVVHKISSELGENPDHVSKAVEAGISSILAGVMKAATSSGADRLVETLKQDPSELSHSGGLDGVLGNLGSLVSGPGLQNLLKYGQMILSLLFGNKLSSIVDLITRSS